MAQPVGNIDPVDPDPDFGGVGVDIELEPLILYRMKGSGYTHPDWGHGKWKGELAISGEMWKCADADPLAGQGGPHRGGSPADGVESIPERFEGSQAPNCIKNEPKFYSSKNSQKTTNIHFLDRKKNFKTQISPTCAQTFPIETLCSFRCIFFASPRS